MPCNLLLWGCESWAIREATMKKLEVFLHRNIRNILKIDIAQVIEERITNISIRERFFDIPTIRNKIAHRQLTFIGKVVRNPDDQITTKFLIAWCNNKRNPGGVLKKNKKNLAQNIRLVVHSAAKDGLLTTWMYFALDNSYWTYLISLIGNRPQEWIGAERNPHLTPPPPLLATPEHRSASHSFRSERKE